jgi:glycosyltransferase involved in cell wall biosynthesis
MEYMAYGVPCVVSDAGGNPELVRDGLDGLLFELDNERELTEKVLDVLGNEARRGEFVRNGRDRVLHEFSIENMCRAYDALFSECARETREEGIR